jgi:hypothetical protein
VVTTHLDQGRQSALRFLREAGAQDVEHLQGTLLEHLVGVEALLRTWGARDALALAGLCHATYGTDGFAPKLLDSTDRGELAGVIGPEAESIVYFYASCDRAALYPQLSAEVVTFRDRFADREFEPSAAQLSDFVDLTVANEVEIAAASPGGPKLWTWLADFCRQSRRHTSEPVYRGAAEILGIEG